MNRPAHTPIATAGGMGRNTHHIAWLHSLYNRSQYRIYPRNSVSGETNSAILEGRELLSYSVQEQECGEVRCVEGVKQIDKLSTIDGISGSESTAGKDTELKELCDGTILEHLCIHTQTHTSQTPPHHR